MDYKIIAIGIAIFCSPFFVSAGIVDTGTGTADSNKYTGGGVANLECTGGSYNLPFDCAVQAPSLLLQDCYEIPTTFSLNVLDYQAFAAVMGNDFGTLQCNATSDGFDSFSFATTSFPSWFPTWEVSSTSEINTAQLIAALGSSTDEIAGVQTFFYATFLIILVFLVFFGIMTIWT